MEALIGRALFLAGVIALLCAGAGSAADPGRDIPGYTHVRFTSEDGAPPGIYAIAQSPDGFLWLGTNAGVFRFDGITFERMSPPSGVSTQSDLVDSLIVTPSGDVWAGHDTGGVSIIRHGVSTEVHPSWYHGSGDQIVQGPDGSIWVATDSPTFTHVYRFRDGRWDVFDSPGALPRAHLANVMLARDGTFYAALVDQIARLRPGSGKFEAIGAAMTRGSVLAQGPDGRLWVVNGQGVREMQRDGRPVGPARYIFPDKASKYRAMFDQTGAFWTAASSVGLVRLGRGREASFFSADGLTSRFIGSMATDREGDIWVGTEAGLDLFRPANVLADPAVQGSTGPSYHLRSGAGFAVTRDGQGAVYVTSGEELFRVIPGQPVASMGSTPLDDSVACGSRSGGVWRAERTEMVRRNAGRVVRIALPRGGQAGNMWGCLEDHRGRLWVSFVGWGTYRHDDRGWRHFTLTPEIPTAGATTMAEDAQGRILAAAGVEAPVRIDGDRLERPWTRKDVTIGLVNVIYQGPGDLLLGGYRGLSRVVGDRLQTLSVLHFPFLADVSGIVQTREGETWVASRVGLVRMSTRDLDAAFGHPDHALSHRVFDGQDGLPGIAQGPGANTIVEGVDGRLWVATYNGIGWIDPRRLSLNRLEPPVVIRSVSSGGVTYPATDGLTLPKGAANLEIDYTALSLPIPKRVRFLYRLDGVDRGWVDPGARRQAFYTNLAPGRYRFQVIAANNDGIWNQRGAALTFTVPPTFFQSRLFLLLCALAAALVFWSLYALRVRQLAAGLRAQLEARLAERERIARELHDTLLQSVQGLIWRFQSIAERISPEHSAHGQMLQALDRADQVMVEGRDRVQELRLGDDQTTLPETLTGVADRLLADSGVEARVTVVGSPCPLHPAVADEVIRIGEEAIFNVVRHARASRIEIGVGYGEREFTLRISDDGVGMDDGVLAAGGRDRHFGLMGMRERAAKIGAAFALASRPGAGTEVRVAVPAALAYKAARRRWRFSLRPLVLGQATPH